MFPLITKHFALNKRGQCRNENKNTKHKPPFDWNLTAAVCLWQYWTDLTSGADVLFIAYPSRSCGSTTTVCRCSCTDGWLFLPEESWGCQNPCGLLGGSFSDSISWSEWVGKKSLSTMPNGSQEGKQIERQREEEEEEEGGRGGGWMREHKRLLLVMCMALKSPQGCGVPAFST